MKMCKPISLLLLGFLNIGDQSIASPTSITYTQIEDCIERVENDNAAFSELQCANLGQYSLTITQQSPLYFNILLKRDGKTWASELDTISHEQPMTPGKAIEWHLVEGVPRFMVFRMFVEEANQPLDEQLTLSWVNGERICPLASVGVKNNANANEKVRSLISDKYQGIKTCPSEIVRF